MKLWLSLLAFASAAFAADTCGNGQQCPEDSPCCSQYGECGTGAYCLAACDIIHSFNSSACVPLPVCQSQTWEFTSTDSIVDQTKYLGKSDDYGWVTNGEVVEFNDNVLLTMANGTYGTVISSTKAVWYGKVSATFKTSRTQGVVSAFILMSGVKDEIDYEFIGSFLDDVQTNFYWQGTLNYTNSLNVSLSDTFENYHTYEIDWTPDTITWSIDGQVGRVLNRVDTFNATSGIYEFPQTPSIVQLSIWPGGSDLNAEGTIDWAGGAVDWNSPDIQNPGYFYVTLKEITVECYDPPSGTPISGNTSYVFANLTGLSSDVQITDDRTYLGSFEATGFDMDAGSENDSAIPDATGQSIPTGIPAGNDGQRGQDSSSADSDIPDASAVSTSTSSTSIVSIKATTTSKGTTKGTSASDSTESSTATSLPSVKSSAKSTASTTGESSEGSSVESSADSSADSTAESSAAGTGFQQNGQSTTTGASNSNSASSLALAYSGFAGAVLLVAVLCI